MDQNDRRKFEAQIGQLVEDMRRTGLSDRAIAREIVRLMPRTLRRHVTFRSEHNYLGAHVGRSVVAAFNIEAKTRDMALSRLISRTLQSVATDKLFGAVLDHDDNGGK